MSDKNFIRRACQNSFKRVDRRTDPHLVVVGRIRTVMSQCRLRRDVGRRRFYLDSIIPERGDIRRSIVTISSCRNCRLRLNCDLVRIVADIRAENSPFNSAVTCQRGKGISKRSPGSKFNCGDRSIRVNRLLSRDRNGYEICICYRHCSILQRKTGV